MWKSFFRFLTNNLPAQVVDAGGRVSRTLPETSSGFTPGKSMVGSDEFPFWGQSKKHDAPDAKFKEMKFQAGWY